MLASKVSLKPLLFPGTGSGLDFQMAVRLELPRIGRPHVMQGENGANARKNRPQQMMRARIIQRFQAGSDDSAAELLHSGTDPITAIEFTEAAAAKETFESASTGWLHKGRKSLARVAGDWR